MSTANPSQMALTYQSVANTRVYDKFFVQDDHSPRWRRDSNWSPRNDMHAYSPYITLLISIPAVSIAGTIIATIHVTRPKPYAKPPPHTHLQNSPPTPSRTPHIGTCPRNPKLRPHPTHIRNHTPSSVPHLKPIAIPTLRDFKDASQRLPFFRREPLALPQLLQDEIPHRRPVAHRVFDVHDHDLETFEGRF